MNAIDLLVGTLWSIAEASMRDEPSVVRVHFPRTSSSPNMTRVVIVDAATSAITTELETNGTHADTIRAFDPFHKDADSLVAVEVDAATVNAARAIAGFPSL